jgi:drug/metabolite transporter (DMT)-like permease
MNNNRYWGLITGVAAISFSPLAVKMVSFTPSVSAFYRSAYAALFFLMFSLARFKSQFGVKHTKWLWPSIIAGVFLGIDLVFWHKTIIYLGAGPATFLGNSQIIFVTLFAAVVFRECIPKAFYFIVAIVLSGLYMLMPPAIVSVTRNMGYLLGIVVGITYAGLLIGLRYAKMLSRDDYPELLSLTVVFLASSIYIALYCIGIDHDALFVGGVKSHVIMAITALMCQTIGWYMINTNITSIPAHEGSLILVLQPVLATVWGIIFFREPCGLVQTAGIVLTIAGIVIYQTRYAQDETCKHVVFEE